MLSKQQINLLVRSRKLIDIEAQIQPPTNHSSTRHQFTTY